MKASEMTELANANKDSQYLAELHRVQGKIRKTAEKGGRQIYVESEFKFYARLKAQLTSDGFGVSKYTTPLFFEGGFWVTWE